MRGQGGGTKPVTPRQRHGLHPQRRRASNKRERKERPLQKEPSELESIAA